MPAYRPPSQQGNSRADAQRARSAVGEAVRGRRKAAVAVRAHNARATDANEHPDNRRAARLARDKVVERLNTMKRVEAERRAKAIKAGYKDDELPQYRSVSTPRAPGVSPQTDTTGDPTPASNAPAVAGRGNTKGSTTRAVTPRKRDYTVDAKNAKKGTVLKKALKMYGDPRKDPSKTGEMLQDGAKSPHHVTLSGKEFQSFKKKYIATHKKAGGANLSDWSLRAMARMLKGKNSEAIRRTYGFGEHKPPSAEG